MTYVEELADELLPRGTFWITPASPGKIRREGNTMINVLRLS
ncbi:MAG: hypothetical protein CM15mP25_0320 [Gammaproteobacteria bacterium]|nr:MAG: hypothetical protein CM15mP25_0320 [Gammaproteobacteria bacterium]